MKKFIGFLTLIIFAGCSDNSISSNNKWYRIKSVRLLEAPVNISDGDGTKPDIGLILRAFDTAKGVEVNREQCLVYQNVNINEDLPLEWKPFQGFGVSSSELNITMNIYDDDYLERTGTTDWVASFQFNGYSLLKQKKQTLITRSADSLSIIKCEIEIDWSE